MSLFFGRRGTASLADPAPTAVPPSTPALVQSAQGSSSTQSAPLVLTLAALPTVGNQIVALIGYSPQPTDYDYAPVDPTWTLTLAGRSGPSADPYNRVLVATKTVVPGDGRAFSFYPRVSTGGGAGAAGVLLEISGTAGLPQTGFGAYVPSSSAQTTPALTPAAANSLALAFTFGTRFAPATYASGWSAVSAPTPFAVALDSTLAPDASTPIATTFTSYSPGDIVTGTLLLAPGPAAATPVATPAAGSTTAATQTVALACGTPGSTIFYTLDGSLPTTSSTVYTGPFTFDRTTTLGVLATAPGYAPSGVALYPFVVAAGTLLGVGLPVGPLPGNLHGYIPFPNDAWHTPIDTAAVDGNSAAALAQMGSTGQNNLSPTIGMPYDVVDSTPGHPFSTPLSAFSPNVSPADPDGNYVDQSDVTLVPIPANPSIEGKPAPGVLISYNDQHTLVFDRAGAALYEFWRSVFGPASASRPTAFSATAAAIFDLTLADPVQRPYTFTSADAGGLSVFEGLARFSEVQDAIADGSMCLKHAIRMDSATFGAASVGSSGYGYFQLPATHSAATGRQAITDADLIYYGMRIRLKAAFDVSGYSPANQVILNTGKKFGWMLADIAQHHSFSFDLDFDPRWDQGDAQALYAITPDHLEVVQKGTLYNGASYPTGNPPSISSFTASGTSVALGQTVTLACTLLHASYGYIDAVGLIRSGQPLAWTPTARGTTTLTLTAQGLVLAGSVYGTGDGNRVTASLTVTVT